MKRQKFRKLFILLSFFIFPITFYYLSPYLIIQGGFEGVITGSFLVFFAQFITSLFFGRAFCSWICPAGGLQECCAMAVDKPVSKKARYIKYFIWLPWIISVILSIIFASGIHTIDFFYMTEYGISISNLQSIITYFAVLTLLTIVTLLVGRRGACHSICWMAPFMIIGTKIKNKLHIPSLHLKSSPSNCTKCGKCTKNCPMSLDVQEMVLSDNMEHSECILCAECADGCPRKAIQIKICS